MLLSVVIINYNTFQLTCDCIRSIKETAHVEHEIILVDNNSKECAPEKFRDVFPDVNLVALTENVGFGRANNRGVEEARGKYVLLLNSDTIVHQGTLDQTVGYLENHPDVDILGCEVRFQDNAVQSTAVRDEAEHRLGSALKYLIKRNSFFVAARLFWQNRRSARQEKSGAVAQPFAPGGADKTGTVIPNHHQGQRIGSLVGVFLLMKRSVFDETKGFDPDFFLYYEEIEWFVKRLRGYTIVYYPQVFVTHLHGGSDVHRTMNRQFYVSQHLFWYKLGYGHYGLYLFFSLLDIPSRLLVWLVFRRKRPSEDVPDMLRALTYAPSILRYPNGYGRRRTMLKLRYLKKNNL